MSGTPEKINGAKSIKFTLAELPSGALADAVSFGGGDAATVVRSYNGAIWVMEDGYSSKLELSGSGQYEGGSTPASKSLSVLPYQRRRYGAALIVRAASIMLQLY
jgi:hypothetical protein